MYGSYRMFNIYNNCWIFFRLKLIFCISYFMENLFLLVINVWLLSVNLIVIFMRVIVFDNYLMWIVIDRGYFVNGLFLIYYVFKEFVNIWILKFYKK